MPPTETPQGSWMMPAFEDATVVDAMHPGLLTCPPEESLTEVARMLASHRVHAIVVASPERQADGGEHVDWAVLSDSDLVAAAVSGAEGRTAGEVAATEPLTVERDARLADAARLMTEHEVTHLLVVADGSPAGVLSTLDVARAIAWGRA